MSFRFLLAAFLLAVPLGSASADGEILRIITAEDQARLDAYDETRTEAIAEAKNGGAPRDVAVLEDILARPALSFAGFDMSGQWQCRTIKVGGLAPLVIYGWFRCKVSDDGSGWVLEKLSGSQRTKGRFFTESDTRLTYLGSYFVAGDSPPSYGTGPETDQAGYVFRTGTQQWRIEFPSPRRESKLDMLEFRPQ